MEPERTLVDRFARQISYLRMSVTDRCDLRCTYCMPERQTFLPRAEMLTLDELDQIAAAFIKRGIQRIRLTGGEPLVRRDVMDLIRSLGKKVGRPDGLKELTLTTNGTHLAGFADDLRAAGILRINVSLDTLDPTLFAKLTRRDKLASVLDGLEAAKAAGLSIKLNVVALKGLNEAELPDLIAWAHARRFDISLIETMPLGEVEEDRFDRHLSLATVRARLNSQWTLVPSAYRTGGPARYFDIVETGGRLGLITPLSNNFCDNCNRIRITATGQLYGCLGGREQVDLRGALRSADPDFHVAAAIDLAMRIKPARHDFAIDRPGASPAVDRHMSLTGG